LVRCLTGVRQCVAAEKIQIGTFDLMRLLGRRQASVSKSGHSGHASGPSRRRSTLRLTPLLFRCARTVSELYLFERLRLLFERKQIPRFVVNIRNSGKAMEPLEATQLPWAQGVGRSNRPAPTKPLVDLK
jgi:hypothetical protein